MKRNRVFSGKLVILGLFLAVLFSCGLNSSDRISQEEITLTISAAASLKDVMSEIEIVRQQEQPNIKVIYNFGASASLQNQIEQGAPADIFISADDRKMDMLEQKGLLLTESRQRLLSNQIALIVPKISDRNLDGFENLASLEIETVALGKPNSVPAGKYAEEVLQYYQISDRIKNKIVYGKDVRQVLNYVVTGNVDAGIVYYSDTLNSDRVQTIAIAPRESHSAIVYSIAAIETSTHREAARQSIDLLFSDRVREIFHQHGFTDSGEQN